jgi:hypothetical protein
VPSAHWSSKFVAAGDYMGCGAQGFRAKVRDRIRYVFVRELNACYL